MTTDNLVSWIEGHLRELLEWKASCVDDIERRAALLDWLGDRNGWVDAAGKIVRFYQDDYADMEQDLCPPVGVCGHIAKKLLIDTTVKRLLDAVKKDQAWQLKCSVRLLLAILADFENTPRGYFSELLGVPEPPMHIPKKSKGKNRRTVSKYAQTADYEPLKSIAAASSPISSDLDIEGLSPKRRCTSPSR
jgi:hypothetical protein